MEEQYHGIWVGKYESSEDTGSTVKIVPNTTSWRSINVSEIFNESQSMASENGLGTGADTHMLKNSEWGAVAYLTQSKYGRNGAEVTINNNSNYITGIAADTISVGGSSATTNSYNTAKGMLASTTGNITGIYDMSGGAWEYVMGVLEGDLGLSGFSTLPTDTKYYNSYKKDGTGSDGTLNYAQNSDKQGDAIYETSSNSANTGTLAWNTNFTTFVYFSRPFFVRGRILLLYH